MKNKHIIVKKSRLIAVFVGMLMCFAVVAVALLLAQQRAITIGYATEEADNDIKFLSGLIREAYLKKDYTGIESMLTNWVNSNSQEHMLRVEAANGFVIFQYHRDVGKHQHTKAQFYATKKEIHNGDRLLMRISLVRDVGSMMQEYYHLRDKVFLFSLLLMLLLGAVLWRMMNLMIFVPLESEIDKRLLAEGKLRDSHGQLEISVDKRTDELLQANQVLEEVLGKYRQSEVQMAKLSSALEQTDDIVVITNKDGVIEYVKIGRASCRERV